MSKQQKQAKSTKEQPETAAPKQQPKVLKQKGPVPMSYAPKGKVMITQSFAERAAAASMLHAQMLNGNTGEYAVPITWGGKPAGTIIISPIDAAYECEEPFYALKVVASSFPGIRADEGWYLPVNFLKFKALRQTKQTDRLFAWQNELHAALRGMIGGDIYRHFGQHSPTVATPKPVVAVESNVVDINVNKKANVVVSTTKALSFLVLSNDGLYPTPSGVVLASFARAGVRKIAVKHIPKGYEPLRGMQNTNCYASDVNDTCSGSRLAQWIRVELDMKAKESVAA